MKTGKVPHEAVVIVSPYLQEWRAEKRRKCWILHWAELKWARSFDFLCIVGALYWVQVSHSVLVLRV